MNDVLRKIIKFSSLLVASAVYMFMVFDKTNPDLLRTFLMKDLQTKKITESQIDYYHRIKKTNTQIRFAVATDKALLAMQVMPFVVSLLTQNSMMYVAYAGSYGATMISGVIMRKLVKEPRPDDAENKTSFPSGHSGVAMCVATILLIAMKNKLIGCFAVIFAFLIAGGRLFANVHYPIDVCCGLFNGFLCTMLVWLCIKAFDKKFMIFHKNQ